MLAGDLVVSRHPQIERLPMRRPLVALAVAFAAGILLQHLLGLAGWVCWSAAGLLAATAAGAALSARGGSLRFLAWAGAVLALGCIRGQPRTAAGAPPLDGRVIVEGSVRTGPERRSNTLRLEVDLDRIRPPGQGSVDVRARARLTVIRQEGIVCPRLLPGDRVLVLTSLHPPRTSRNPGVLDVARLLHRRGIDWTGTVRSCRELLVTGRALAPGPHAWSERARAELIDFIMDRPGSSAAKGVLAALTVGERGMVSPDVADGFRAAGLAHLLAVSGLHLGFVALGVYLLLVKLLVFWRWLALRMDVRRLAAGVAIPVTVFYALLAGAGLPAVRACIMVVFFLVAVIARRETDGLQVLAAAALVILAVWPHSLFEASFLLSFAAVTCILVGTPHVFTWLHLSPASGTPNAGEDVHWSRRLGGRIVQFVIVSLLAMLGTAPLVASLFNQASLAGPLANLLAVPLGAWVVVPLGLLAALLFPLAPTLAGVILDLALVAAGFLADLAGWIGSWSWASIQVATPSLLEVLLWYGGLFSLLAAARRPAARWIALACAAGMLVSWGARECVRRLSDDLVITFLDVGQGDAALIRLPDDRTVLIDGGPGRPDGFDAGRFVVAPFLWGQGYTRLDVVAVTHPETDHAGGLPSVIRLFRPREIWTTMPLEQSPVTRRLARAAREAGSTIRILRAGDRPLEAGGCGLDVVWPPADTGGLRPNERSLVVRVECGERAALLTGDLEKQGEEGLLAREVDVSADLLKVGHHGGKGATGAELLRRVKPRTAVVSVGAGNSHGMPHPEVLARLDAAGVRVLRTDSNGAISAVCEQRGWRFEPWIPTTEEARP